MLVPAKTTLARRQIGQPSDVYLLLGTGAAVGEERLLGMRSGGRLAPPAGHRFPKYRQLLPTGAHRRGYTIAVADLTRGPSKRVIQFAQTAVPGTDEFSDGVVRSVGGSRQRGIISRGGAFGRIRRRAAFTIAFSRLSHRRVGFLHSDRVTFRFTTPISRRFSDPPVR